MEGEPEPEVPAYTLLGNTYEARMKVLVKDIASDYDEFNRLYRHTPFYEVMEQVALNSALSYSKRIEADKDRNKSREDE